MAPLLSQDRSPTYFVGVDVVKPLFMVGKGTTLEGSFRMKILENLYYRNSLGYAYFNDTITRKKLLLEVEGYFTKQGFDIVFNPDSKVFFSLFGMSAFLSRYRETGRGIIKGNYFPTYVSDPFIDFQTIGGLEVAYRMLFRTWERLFIEFSIRGTMPWFGTESIYHHRFIPGAGYGIIHSEKSVMFSPGLDLKIYYAFGMKHKEKIEKDFSE